MVNDVGGARDGTGGEGWPRRPDVTDPPIDPYDIDGIVRGHLEKAGPRTTMGE